MKGRTDWDGRGVESSLGEEETLVAGIWEEGTAETSQREAQQRVVE